MLSMWLVCVLYVLVISSFVHVLSNAAERNRKKMRKITRPSEAHAQHSNSPIHILTHTTVKDKEFFIQRIFFVCTSCLLGALIVCLLRTRVLSFYVGHPMETVLFLASDRPAVSMLTYQSSYSGKTHAIHRFFLFTLHDTYFIAWFSHSHKTLTYSQDASAQHTNIRNY